jgi:uncharacterized protein YyaL (SSP411 family)
MGRAFWALYQVTADSRWLARASAAADFIRAHFSRGAMPGFAASDTGWSYANPNSEVAKSSDQPIPNGCVTGPAWPPTATLQASFP